MKVRITPAQVEDAPFFEPWMGSTYVERRKAFVAGDWPCCSGLWHVMGESHYGQVDEATPSFTKQVVEELALTRHRFFDTILSIVSGSDVDQREDRSRWQQYAYSNFVQDVLPDDDRRPASSHWVRARRAFFGQLAITRPKQLLVIGKAQWHNLPSEGFSPVDPIKIDPESKPIHDVGVYAYETDGVTAFTVATWIYHPSSRGLLNMNEARERVRAVTMVSCNVLSESQRDEEGWFYEDRSAT